MKNGVIKQLTKTTVIICLALLPCACTKNFAEYNLNPDGSVVAQPALLFSDALVKTSTADMEARTNYCHAFMQYGYSDFWSGTTYSLSDNISNRYWNNFYIPVLRNLEYIVPILKNKPDMATTYAAARIWKVFIYQKLTDMYGDIPYFQAGQALSSGIFTPEYDTQQVIYADLINELRAAVSLLKSNPAMAVGGDQFYGGSATQWRKLANAMLLKIGMRLIKVDPAQAALLVNEAYIDGVMTSNMDMPVLKHNSSADNGFFFNLSDQHFFLHQTLVSKMKAAGDPRLNVYGAIYNKAANAGGIITSKDTAQYIGYSFKATGPLPNARVNVSIFGLEETPFFDFQFAEVQFLLAEAVLRGYISGDANEFYRSGVTAQMQSLALLPTGPSINNAQIIAYLARNPLVDPLNPTAEKSIERINTEFWIAGFIFDADEVYANWRRTGYPKLVPNPNTITGPSSSRGVIPRKLPYPQSEFTLNSTNVNKALAVYGGLNDFNEKARVWWDK